MAIRRTFRKKGEYIRSIPGLAGVNTSLYDVNGDITHPVFLKNMYKDHSTGGLCSVPGYRRITSFPGKIHGIFSFTAFGDTKIAVHEGTSLHIFDHSDRDSLPSDEDSLPSDEDSLLSDDDSSRMTTVTGLADNDSSAVYFCGDVWIADGEKYRRLIISRSGDGVISYRLTDACECAYSPRTYVDGKRYMQRNMLSDTAENRYTSFTAFNYPQIYSYTNYNNTRISGFAPGKVCNTLLFRSGVSVTSTAFAGNPDVKTVISRSTDIGASAFAGCPELENAFITSVSSNLFKDCKKLKLVSLLGSGYANYDAFSGCDSIEKIFAGNISIVRTNNVPFFSGIVGKSFTLYIQQAEPDSGYTVKLANTYMAGHINIDGEHVSDHSFNGQHTQPPEGGILGYAWGYEDIVPVSEAYVNDPTLGWIKMVCGEKVGYVNASEVKPAANIYGSRYDSYPCFDIDLEDITIPYCIKDGIAYPVADGDYTPDTVIDIFTSTEALSPFDSGSSIGSYSVAVSDSADILYDVKQGGIPLDSYRYGGLYTVKNGKRHLDSVIFTENLCATAPVDCLVGCEEYSASRHSDIIEDAPDVYAANPDYTGKVCDAVNNCRKISLCGGRLFLYGNPSLPHTVFYSGSDADGTVDPAYFGILDLFNEDTGKVGEVLPSSDGIDILPSSDSMTPCVVHRKSVATDDPGIPCRFVVTDSVSGIDCPGKGCVSEGNTVIISSKGIERLAQTNGKLRLFHESTRADALISREDLKNSFLGVRKNHLVLVCPGGNIYLADTADKTADSNGIDEYEWYPLSGIGEYVGRHDVYRLQTCDIPLAIGEGYVEVAYYVGDDPRSLLLPYNEMLDPTAEVLTSPLYKKITGDEKYGMDVTYYSYEGRAYAYPGITDTPVMTTLSQSGGYVEYEENGDTVRLPLNTSPEEGYVSGESVLYSSLFTSPTGDAVYLTPDGESTLEVAFVVRDGKALLCDDTPTGLYSGGELSPVCALLSVNDTLYLGTVSGSVMCVNDDLTVNDSCDRYFTFDGNPEECEIVTAWDDAGYPSLAKDTVPSSLLIYTGDGECAGFDTEVMTDADIIPEKSSLSPALSADFSRWDFTHTSFAPSGLTVSSVKDNTKGWCVKRYIIRPHFSLSKPFTLFRIEYRYKIRGNRKGK